MYIAANPKTTHHVHEPLSYWQQTTTPVALSSDLPSTVDVAVIGGGLLGAATTYWLARAGRATVLLERTLPAYGATGRNGGFVSVGLAESYSNAIARLGHETARAVMALTLESRILLRQVLAEEEIACDYREPGSLNLALGEEQLAGFAQTVAALQTDGFDATLLDREQVHQNILVDNLMKQCYTPLMKVTLTAKLKLHTTPEQFQALRATQLAYRDALNYVSRHAFEHGKMSNKVALQEGTYAETRARYKIPAQMACSIPRQVGATYKTLWTKVKQNAAHRKAGQTKKRYKGLDKPPKYVSPTLTYQHRKDYSVKREQHVSILTLSGRVIVPYTGYAEHLALIQKGALLGAAKLWYDKPKKQFYLLISLEIEVADPTPETHTSVAGVDVGVRYLAVTSTTTGDCSFHTGKGIVKKANHYARLRKRLQKKGTRAATRRLVVISGRERRLKQDANHVISKRIVDQHPHSLIGLENLTDIRERTRRKHGKKASKKQRRANAAYSRWSFAELQSMIAQKALLHSSMAIKVDAHYTSKACPVCGHTSDGNRPNKGLLFVCQHCQYTLHADLVGARNITMRTLLVRQDWTSTGQLSVAPGSLDGPDVSAMEAKAARLKRYAELRWMLDTSPRASAGSI